jgi:hypothetical protein
VRNRLCPKIGEAEVVVQTRSHIALAPRFEERAGMMTLECFALDWLVTRLRDDLVRMPTADFITEYCSESEWNGGELRATTHTGFGDDEDDIATFDWEFREDATVYLTVDVNGETHGPVQFDDASEQVLKIRDAL